MWLALRLILTFAAMLVAMAVAMFGPVGTAGCTGRCSRSPVVRAGVRCREAMQRGLGVVQQDHGLYGGDADMAIPPPGY